MRENLSHEDAYLDSLLDQLVRVEPTLAWDDVVDLARRMRRTRGSLVGAKRPRLLALVLLAAIVALVGLAFTAGRAEHSQAGGQHHRVGHGPTISLSGYHMRLPAGYQLTRDQACPRAGTALGQPMTVLQSWKAAASASGGCLRLEFVAGTSVVPSGASSVQVGSTTGYVTSSSASPVTLYVVVPSLGSDHYLVLIATGLSPARLIAVAASAFPS
jgi:hypothetical protein